MRFDGKLDKWNDDRGFGFITPTRGGEPVFVHVSAFPRDGRRPQLGEPLTFEVEPAGDGKKRAIHVQRPGSSAESRAPAASHAPRQEHSSRRAGRREAKQGSVIGGVVIALLLLGLGAYAYTKFTARLSAAALPASRSPSTPAEAAGGSGYRCDGRIHCSQMTSCEEAKFFLKNCPGTQMDGDRNGIPCEKQWCRGVFAR
jgi:cold shock CspA family protein